MSFPPGDSSIVVISDGVEAPLANVPEVALVKCAPPPETGAIEVGVEPPGRNVE
jgi:hypothetical protein